MTTPTTVQVKLKLRSDTAASWTSANPTLLAGELGRETDTGKIKIGDGSTAWTSLAYQPFGAAITNADISATAEIAVSKLADGTARQLLQTDAAGTGVEWASNIDIPGTLDVTSAATFDSTIGASAGTASLPSITFTGDLNTGIYSPGADQVAVVTGGTGRLFIDASGNVGVGTVAAAGTPINIVSSTGPAIGLGASNGSYLGTVYGTTYSADEHFFITPTGGYHYYKALVTGPNAVPENVFNDDGANLDFRIEGDTNANLFFVDASTDRVGINDSTPDALLTVNGVASFGAGSASAPSIAARGDLNTGVYFPGADQVAISTGGSGRLFVDASGNVGITESSPSSYSAGSGVPTIVLKGSSATFPARSGAIAFLSQDATSAKTWIYHDTDFYIQNTTATNIRFLTNNAERLRITSAGLVGIGTSSPAALLTTKAAGFTPSDNANFVGVGLFLDTTASAGDGNYGSAIAWTRPGGVQYVKTAIAPVQEGADIDVQGLGFFTSSGAAATDDPTEKVRITSTGRVGIGTTSPSQLLHVSGGYALFDGLRIKGTDTANSIFQSAAFGLSTNNYITFATGTGEPERARIDSSGRLLVGTSNSTDNARFNSKISVVGAGASQLPGIVVNGYTGTTPGNAPFIDLGRSRGTTDGSYTEVVDNDYLGYIVFRGADGVGWSDAAQIYAQADGDWTTSGDTTDSPGRLVFSTTADGASTPTERLRITSAGLVGIGATSPAAAFHVLNSSTTPAQIESSGVRSILLFRDSGTGANYPFVGSDNSALILRGGNTSAENVRIDSSGRLLVGTSTARSNFGTGTQSARLQIEGTSGDTARIAQVQNANNANAIHYIFAKSRGTTVGSNTIVQSNDNIGILSFEGSDGTNFVPAAQITGAVDGTPGLNDMPGRLVFSTTADGASSPTERMRINSSGECGVFTADVSGLACFEASQAGGAGATRLLFQGRYGATGIYSGTESFRVESSGDVKNTNNSYGAISDIKLKENIVDANSQWDDIKALQVRNYNFKEGQTHTQIGLVAQEVELVSPGLVSESPDRDEDGNDLGTVTKSVNYSVLYMKAVKALQEAMERIETLEASNTDLLARVSALESA